MHFHMNIEITFQDFVKEVAVQCKAHLQYKINKPLVGKEKEGIRSNLVPFASVDTIEFTPYLQ